MLVDNSVVGSIIGKGGQTIRKISLESGSSIQVQGRDEQSPSQLERRVTITSVSVLSSGLLLKHSVTSIQETTQMCSNKKNE